MKLHPIYKPLYTNTDKRYILVTGGRGSMKSFHTNAFLAQLSYSSGQVILICRYTMVSAKMSVIPEFTEKIELLGTPHHFESSGKEIENLATGSKIYFSGIKTSSGNQTANLKGIKNLSTVLIDEFQEFEDENAFDRLDFTVRVTGQQNRIIMAMNPPTDSHWSYSRWFEKTHRTKFIDGFPIMISTHPDVLHIHTTYLDATSFLSQSFINQAQSLKKSNPEKYAHVILGAWADKKEGAVFKNWIEGDFDNSLPYCYTLDWGFFPDPLALGKVAVDRRRKRIYLDEVIYKTELGTEDLIRLMTQKLPSKNSAIIADTNEVRTFMKLKKKGFNMKKASKGLVKEDIRQIEDYQIVVAPNAVNAKLELKNYVWNDKKASIPIGEYNHLMDGMRYGCRFLTRNWRK